MWTQSQSFCELTAFYSVQGIRRIAKWNAYIFQRPLCENFARLLSCEYKVLARRPVCKLRKRITRALNFSPDKLRALKLIFLQRDSQNSFAIFFRARGSQDMPPELIPSGNVDEVTLFGKRWKLIGTFVAVLYFKMYCGCALVANSCLKRNCLPIKSFKCVRNFWFS